MRGEEDAKRPEGGGAPPAPDFATALPWSTRSDTAAVDETLSQDEDLLSEADLLLEGALLPEAAPLPDEGPTLADDPPPGDDDAWSTPVDEEAPAPDDDLQDEPPAGPIPGPRDEAGWAAARAQAEAAGQWRAHLKRVEAGLRAAPDGDEDLLLRELAATYMGMGVPSRAIPPLTAVIEERPDDTRAEAMLRRIHQEAGDEGARLALDAWLAQARLAPEQAHARLVALADEAARLALPASERACLMDACALRPSELAPFERLDGLLRATHEWPAVAELWALRADLPGEEGHHALLAQAEAQVEAGDLAGAREAVDLALGILPESDAALRLKARVLALQGDREALVEVEHALETEDPLEVALMRAEALLEDADHDPERRQAAELLFRDVLRLRPGDPRAVRGRVRCALAAGDVSAALMLLERAVAGSPPGQREGWLREQGDVHLVHAADPEAARLCYERADALAAQRGGPG